MEEVRPVADTRHDPRLDALEAAAQLVGADGIDELLEAVVGHAGRVVGAAWAAITDLDGQGTADGTPASGDAPNRGWLEAFLAGSRAAEGAGGRGGRGSGAADVVWAPLPQAGLALVLGREGMPYRARERRQVAALARVVDTRLRELRLRPQLDAPSESLIVGGRAQVSPPPWDRRRSDARDALPDLDVPVERIRGALRPDRLTAAGAGWPSRSAYGRGVGDRRAVRRGLPALLRRAPRRGGDRPGGVDDLDSPH